MPTTLDWYPPSRTEQLNMIRVWLLILTAEIRAAWGIATAEFTELGALFAAAQALLQKAQSNERTPVITEQCKAAFSALEAKARFFKEHYYLVPPLTDADLVSLGLKPKKKPPTPTGTPTAQIGVETYLLGRRQLGLRLSYVSGDPEDKANKSFRVYYKLVPIGGDPITDPSGFTESFSTQRKRDLLDFEYEDSGKTMYIAVQVENGKKKGPWGPIVSALIP